VKHMLAFIKWKPMPVNTVLTSSNLPNVTMESVPVSEDAWFSRDITLDIMMSVPAESREKFFRTSFKKEIRRDLSHSLIWDTLRTMLFPLARHTIFTKTSVGMCAFKLLRKYPMLREEIITARAEALDILDKEWERLVVVAPKAVARSNQLLPKGRSITTKDISQYIREVGLVHSVNDMDKISDFVLSKSSA
jgi:hypothetical protein